MGRHVGVLGGPGISTRMKANGGVTRKRRAKGSRLFPRTKLLEKAGRPEFLPIPSGIGFPDLRRILGVLRKTSSKPPLLKAERPGSDPILLVSPSTEGLQMSPWADVAVDRRARS